MRWLKKVKRGITTGRIIINDLEKIIDNLKHSDKPEHIEYCILLMCLQSKIHNIDVKTNGPLAQ